MDFSTNLIDSSTNIETNTTVDEHSQLLECFVCFYNLSPSDSYYYCGVCSIPGHRQCYKKWWANSKKHGKCPHCQQYKTLHLFTPHSISKTPNMKVQSNIEVNSNIKVESKLGFLNSIFRFFNRSIGRFLGCMSA